jgi:restriction system protein
VLNDAHRKAAHSSSLGALSAVESLLADTGTSLHTTDITSEIITRGLWKTDSDVPEEVIQAQLAGDIRKLGTKSRFQRISPRTYVLRRWGWSEPPKQGYRENERLKKLRERFERKFDATAEHERPIIYAKLLGQHGNLTSAFPELPTQIEHHNKQVRSQLREQLHRMDWFAFEELIRDLLYSLGFQDAEVTARSKDKGVDIRGTLVVGDAIRIRMAVQVKRWRNNVQTPVVQQMRGSLANDEQGLIITTSDFSSGAREEAARGTATPLGLMNGLELVKLLTEYEMGARRRTYELFELNSDEVFTRSSDDTDYPPASEPCTDI